MTPIPSGGLENLQELHVKCNNTEIIAIQCRKILIVKFENYKHKRKEMFSKIDVADKRSGGKVNFQD